MEPAEYARMRSLEDEGWWFVARRELALSLLPTGCRRVLDVGCGTGATLSSLGGRGVGVEYANEGLALARQRGLAALARGDATRLPFRDESFDAALALDVFEHIDDDAAALRETVRILRPGGALVSTVPAHPRLWSGHDDALHHKRRYTLAEFRERVAQAGFRIRRLTWCTTLAFPAVAAVRLAMPRRKAQADVRPLPKPVNAALLSVMRAENAVVRRFGAPFGVSLVAVAERPH